MEGGTRTLLQPGGIEPIVLQVAGTCGFWFARRGNGVARSLQTSARRDSLRGRRSTRRAPKESTDRSLPGDASTSLTFDSTGTTRAARADFDPRERA